MKFRLQTNIGVSEIVSHLRRVLIRLKSLIPENGN